VTERQITESHELSRSPGHRAWQQFRRNRLATIGLVIILVLWGATLLAEYVAYHDPYEMNLENPFLPVGSRDHWLGTDNFGRDVFSRIVWGGRASLSVGIVVVGISATIGLILGVISGYYGGWIDTLIMRITDLFFAFPFFILAIGVIAALGPSLKNVMLVLGLVTWPEYARMVRAKTLALREEPFVESARAAGASDIRIMSVHVLPNCLGPVIVMATLGMANAILAAAGLSFLGMGVQPPEPEWGSMLNEARMYMRTAPHLIIVPGLVIMLAVLGLNFLGDGLRDALDPKTPAGR
jgi:peptide/nickel transport system permease protein